MLTLLDVWEGSLDINETILRAEGVVGLMIRLNHISGAHHMDENFTNQWNQAAGFLRAPYFVYSPWYTGRANFEWMISHIPRETTVVFDDVEVTKAGYPAERYADELQIFYDLSKAEYHSVIYIGGWFLSTVTHWPQGEYWWGRYPYYLCPQGDKETWTWAQWRQRSNSYGYKPDPDNKCPGTEEVWQASGDKLYLPGCAGRVIDLNLVNKSLPELETWWGATLPPAPMSQLDILWREAAVHGWNLNP